jgi:DNA polymerase-4
VASTKLVAKVASELRKPDGLVVVPPGDEAAFLAPLPISRLWGVGPSTANALRDFGVVTIGDLARLPGDALTRRFGKHGASLTHRARGVDPDPVDNPDAAKSIGHEHTFDVDTSDREVIERTLLAMADGVAGRLRSSGVKAGTIAVKIRDSSFHTITRQRTLAEPTDLAEPIWRTALDLARPEVAGIRVRLLGVTALNFGAKEQLSLFDSGSGDDRTRRVVDAADRLRRRFGERAVTRARLLRTGLPAPFERDMGTAAERRGEHAADLPRDGRRTASVPDRRDSLGDTDVDEIPPDDA